MKHLILSFLVLFSQLGITQNEARAIYLPAGHPISLELLSELTKEDMSVGAFIDLRVRFPVKINGVTIVNEGAYAEAVVTAYEPPKSFGRPGRIVLQAVSIQTVDDQLVPLQGEKLFKKGKSRSGKAIGVPATIAVGGLLLATPLGISAMVLGVLVKGKKVSVEQGTVLKARVLDNTEIFIL